MKIIFMGDYYISKFSRKIKQGMIEGIINFKEKREEGPTI